jgi:hypothetical protein
VPSQQRPHTKQSDDSDCERAVIILSNNIGRAKNHAELSVRPAIASLRAFFDPRVRREVILRLHTDYECHGRPASPIEPILHQRPTKAGGSERREAIRPANHVSTARQILTLLCAMHIPSGSFNPSERST